MSAPVGSRRIALAVALATLAPMLAEAGYSGGGPSGGKARVPSDCLVGLAGMASGQTIPCTDCDPSCDVDGSGVPDGSCTFRFQVCANLPDAADCAPTALQTVTGKPRRIFASGDLPTPPADASSVCGASVESLVVRTRKGGTKPGRRRIRLAARSLTRPRRADVDVFRFVCNPNPPGQACGTPTTTTTTTIPPTCGNGTVDPGEQCDGGDLAGETCGSRGFSGGTLACAPSCTFDESGCTSPPPSTCTIDMDTSCPDVTPMCGASFSGGAGCFFEGKPGCYASGLKSYKVQSGQTLTIDLSPAVMAVDVFFAAEGAATGTMTFRDAMGAVVGMPLATNGNCLASMPARQQASFPVPVESIEVTASGGTVWVDSLTLSH